MRSFEFKNDASELVLKYPSGLEVHHMGHSEISSADKRSTIFILEGNLLAELKVVTPIAPEMMQPNEFQSEDGAHSLTIVECDNPAEYIRHASLLAQFERFGLMDVNGMRFACAQINQRKTYNFTPLVIEQDEIETVMTALSETPSLRDPPDYNKKTLLVRESGHWCTYHTIFKDGEKPKTFIFGMDLAGYEGLLVLNKDLLLSHEKYVGDFQIQRSPKGCSFFALYAARRLQKIEDYIPRDEDGKKQGLFDYLDKNIKEVRHGFYCCQLPLALITPAQTQQLWEDKIYEYPEVERNHPINKHGECFDTVIDKRKKFSPDGRRRQNGLLDHFREKTDLSNRKAHRTTPTRLLSEAEARTRFESIRSRCMPRDYATSAASSEVEPTPGPAAKSA